MIEESMNSIERIEKAINLEEADRVPVAPLLDYDAARYYGITIKEFFFNPKQAEAAFDSAFNRLGGIDMIVQNPTNSYALKYYSPWSPTESLYYSNWKLPGKDLPDDVIAQFDEKPIMSENDYDRLLNEGLLSFFNFKKAGFLKLLTTEGKARRGRAAFYRKWVVERKVPVMMGGETTIPFEVLSYMRGIQNFLIDLFRRPEKVIEACNWMIDAMITFGLIQAQEVPPNTPFACKGIFQGSARSSADFISPKQFEKFSLPHLRRITEEFAKIGFYSHFHHHSNWTPFLEYFKEFPKKKCVMYLDDRTDIFKAKKVLGDTMCIMGNVSASLLANGTPSDVEKTVKDILDKCADGGGLIISAENPVNCKFENLKALVDATKKYGVYRA